MKKIDFVVNYYWRKNYPETVRLSAWLAIQSLKTVDIIGDILLVDGSLEGDNEIRQICDNEKIMYTHKGKELGFAEGYNCWKMLSSQFIGLMASDIIVNPSAIQKLLTVIADERVGCVFPYLDRCDYQGQIYSYVRKPKTCEPTFMTLNLNIFKRGVLAQINGIDENFSGGYNDVITLMKIRKLGFKVLLVGGTQVTHLGKMTVSNGTTYDWEKDSIKFKNNYPEYWDRIPRWNIKRWLSPLAVNRKISFFAWLIHLFPSKYGELDRLFMRIEPDLSYFRIKN